MELSTYLVFNGNCKEALEFYERTLGAEIRAVMKYAGSPAEKEVPADFAGKVMHARFLLGGQAVMACDAPPDRQPKPGGFSLSISVKDPGEAERLFGLLAEGGKIQMPIQETFWAKRFGMLADRFGIPWMVNCEKPMQS